jgi:hypothetical protein
MISPQRKDDPVSLHDRNILRPLAAQVREIAGNPEQAERKRRLTNHNDLRPERPIVLAYPEGAWAEILPNSAMLCENEKLRGWEWGLRAKVYWWEHFRDDNALEPFFNIGWHVDFGNYGIAIPYEHGAGRGSYHWAAPFEDIEAGFKTLKPPEPTVDRAATHRDLDLANEIFGDLLPARIRGRCWWTSGLTAEAIKLIGLETLMLAPYDQPEALHRLMKWLSDQHLRFLNWLESEGLLSHSNEDDYTGSGGVAYTGELPQPDAQPGMPARLLDIWGFAESQETVGVSPQMFEEFVLPYQIPLLEKFGLNCYGCCEPMHDRIDPILEIPRLRRVSVSPWSDQKIMAEKLGMKYVFSRKPLPTQICLSFDEELIRKDIAATLALAGEGSLEIIMKDTHTVQNEPWRIGRWIQIALEEVDKYMCARVG